MLAPRLALLLVVGAVACGSGGGDGGAGGPAPNQLADLATARVVLGGVVFEAWLVDTEAQQRRGLMGTTEADLAPLPDGTPRGMLFRYPEDRLASIFMRGTAVPLDLAYATAAGRIVETHQLVPFDETSIVAREPVRYAFEAREGTFASRGIAVGDTLVPPAE